MPRFVLVTHVYPNWAREPFGPYYFAWPLDAAQALGFEVEVLTTNCALPRMAIGYSGNDEAAEEVRDAIRIRRFPLLSGKRFLSPALIRALFTVRADCIAVHGYGYSYTEAASLAARTRRIPLLFTPHFHTSSRAARRLYDRMIGRRVLNSAGGIQVFLNRTKQDLARLGVDPERCHVLPHPLNPSTVRVLTAARTDSPARRAPVILGVGGLIPRKGWAHAINALPAVRELVPDTELLIMGYSVPTGSAHVDSLRQLAAEQGVGEHVTIVPDPSPDQLARGYSKAALFTFPSAIESFGIVLLEAMVAGLPVVANAGVGFEEIVPANEAGVFNDVTDTATYATSLARVLLDRDTRLRYGEFGETYARSHFDGAVLTPKLQHLLAELTTK